MIGHYLKLSLKVFAKHRYHTVINIFGLVSGMLSALIIAKYIGGTLQSDAFHLNREQIYSISQQESVAGNNQQERPDTYLGVADLVAQFPEALRTTRYLQHVEALVIAGSRESFTENRIFISDSNFFHVFTFPFLHGNPSTAFSRANTIVLTQSTARKYFADDSPIGKILSIRTSWGEETAYEVTGVIQNIPALSRFTFDILINRPNTNTSELWNLPDYSTYVLLDKSGSAAELAQKVTARLRYVPELKSARKDVTLTLRSLSDVRLSDTERLMVMVGMMIVAISWANYINQGIAQAYWRTRETGILTVLGATRVNLSAQFGVESALVSSTVLLMVAGAYLVLEDWLRSVTHGHLLPLLGDPTHINAILLLVLLVGTVSAALAPAWAVLRQNPLTTLRSALSPHIGGVAIRQVFVVVQFTISTVLLVGIFVVTRQLDYMETKDKGINLDNILIVKAPMAKDTTWTAKAKTLQLVKQQIGALPFVKDVTSSTTVPGEEYRQETYLSLQGHDSKILVHQNGVDENFFSLYQAEFVAGQDFVPHARSKNSESIILNESAASALGFSDPDKLIHNKVIDHENPGVTYDVIGVIRDYHQTSLRYAIRPLAFRYNLFRGHCSLLLDPVRLKQGTFDAQIASLRDIWKQSYPDASFDYFFLKEKFQAQDRADQYFASIFQAFTGLSVVLSCLGLFGLSILISTRRQKEVGIRKTFGATSLDILSLFMKGYLGPLATALIIGSASAHFLMDDWLTAYAHRIEIGPGLIFPAILTLIAIFTGTVSYHTIKAAMTNPARTLRN